jgi:hypothetical protein
MGPGAVAEPFVAPVVAGPVVGVRPALPEHAAPEAPSATIATLGATSEMDQGRPPKGFPRRKDIFALAARARKLSGRLGRIDADLITRGVIILPE